MAIQGSDGNWYNSQVDADAGNPNGRVDITGASAANYKFMNLQGQILLIILFIVPLIMAKVVGIVFSLLGKIPIVGRIVQTLIVACAWWLVGLLIFSEIFYMTPIQQTMQVIAAFTFFAAAGYWFYLYHFYVVQYMGTKIYSDVLMKTFAITFFGTIGAAIFAAIKGLNNRDSAIPIFIVFIASLIFYVIKTRQFAADAAQIRGQIPAKTKTLFTIIALVIVGLGIFYGVTTQISENAKSVAEEKEREKELTELIAKDPSMAIIRRETPFQATVTSTINASNYSDKVEIPTGTTITVTGWTIGHTGSGKEYALDVTYKNTRYSVKQKDFGSINPR
jgi:hypothetical protein